MGGTARGAARALLATWVVAAGLAGATAPPAAAADPSWPGRSVTSFRPAPGGTGRAAIALGDGTLMVGGTAGGDFALFHRDMTGRPDLGFGGDGYVTTDFGGRVDVVHALARAPGSAVVAAGSSGGDLALARYDVRGALDRAFGTEGRVTTDLGSAVDAAYGTLVQPGGKVVVAGGNVALTIVLRYRADGVLDPSFGTGGRVILPWARAATAMLAQPDGGLLVTSSGGTSVDVARLDADGRLDPTFGTGGAVRLPTGAATSANALTLLDDGRVLVAGGRAGDVLLARLLPTGQPDPTFGAAGLVTSDLGRAETAYGILISDDGRLRVVGEATDGTGFAATYLPNGTRDAAAAFGGLVVTAPLRGVAAVADGIVTTGTKDGLMFQGGFGGPDGTTFDFGTTVERASALARQPDGRIVVVGETSGSTGLLRYTIDGALDPTFGSGGKVVSDLAWFPKAVAVLPGGRIVVTGTHGNAAALVAFRADGAVDHAFGTAGRTLTDVGGNDWPSSLTVLPDGKLLLGGAASDGAFLARYSPDGVPDPTFGDGGLRRSAFPGYAGPRMRTVRQPDGKTLATGVEFGLSRFNPDGSPDTGFGGDGHIWFDWHEITDYRVVSALALQPDGRILVGGAQWWGGTFVFAVVRYNADGSRDPSWRVTYAPLQASGYHDDAVRDLFVQPDGKVLAAGETGVIRYHADGTLDEGYGTTGRVLLQHPLSAMADGFFGADGRLWAVGTDADRASGVPGGFALAVNRIPEVGYFHALAPARILDTRTGLGVPTARIGPVPGVRLQVTGTGGVPSKGVSAVVLNVTVTEPTGVTYVTVWPGGPYVERPVASNLNVGPGETRANLVTVGLDPEGGVNMFNAAGTVHLIVDVAGWYGDGTDVGGARFHPLSPGRVLDTRTGNGAPIARVGPGGVVDLQVTGRGGVPVAGVSAVVLNLTAVSPAWATYVTAWPTGQARPLASNLNIAAGQVAPNLVTVAVGAGGKVSLYNSGGAVDLVADVAGWYGIGTEAGGVRAHPVAPLRILDTRVGLYGDAPGVIGPGETREVQVTGRAGVPVLDVEAVLVNVTVTQPTASAYLTVWPAGQARPLASNLNFAPGQTVANLVTVPLGPGGRISVFAPGGTAHVIVDVAGWFGP